MKRKCGAFLRVNEIETLSGVAALEKALFREFDFPGYLHIFFSYTVNQNARV